MRVLDDIAKELPLSPEAGLTDTGVLHSRERYGPNRLTPLPREPLWKKFLEKFDEPIIKILLAASLLKIIVDLFNDVGPALGGIALGLVVAVVAAGLAVRPLRPWLPSLLFVTAIALVAASVALGHPSYDGLAIMVAVVLATGVAFAAEYRSDREFEVLNAQKDSSPVKVTRNGTFHTIHLDEVVVGDLVTLEMGDEIPADGRLVRATDFHVDQSLMTGESEPVHKTTRPDDDAEGPEQPGCLYRGTQVVDGVGQMIVTEVGDATMLGQIARRLSAHQEDDETPADGDTEEQRVQRKLTISKELTPLQLKLERLAGLISRVGYAAAVAIFLALLAKGIVDGTVDWPTSLEEFGKVAGRLLNFFVVMVIIIVVAVPEGLPMSVTVSLALAMRKMTRANSLVRQLVACETIGSATVICSDKTGTLTQNRMRVVGVHIAGRTLEKSETGGSEFGFRISDFGFPNVPLDWLALNAAVNSTAQLERKNGQLVPVGNTTEGALLLWLHEGGLPYEQLRLRYPVAYQIHFSSERKRMTTVVRAGEQLVVLVKGATEVLLEQSTAYLAEDGTVRSWDDDTLRAVAAQVADAARRAMRTLAFGYAVLPAGTPADEDALHAIRERLEAHLVFIGFVAIRDPIRPDVAAAVAECHQAGIEVKMITGDNIETARAIATEIGLLDRPDALVFTSAEFNDHNDDENKELMPRLRVLARTRPLDKFRLVRLLQEQNQVVAVTGDGTNDAPALKRADVGLAMGIAGTEVAKEASNIVLLDDAFSTIVKAVHWGRALYENIQRFVQFQLTINVSALAIAFLAPFLGFGEPPFTVLQFLWINIIMDTFAAIALCSEPPREGLMRLPPKRKDESIITPAMLRTILTTAGFFIVVMVVLLLGMKQWPDGSPGWFAGAGPWSDEFPLFTTRQATIFFTVYVMFQVWNQINCRSLTPEVSGLHRLWSNPTFLVIAALIVGGQAIIVHFGGPVFKVEPLRLLDWLIIAVATSSVLVFAEAARRVRLWRAATVQ